MTKDEFRDLIMVGCGAAQSQSRAAGQLCWAVQHHGLRSTTRLDRCLCRLACRGALPSHPWHVPCRALPLMPARPPLQHMAAADLHSRRAQHEQQPGGGEWVMSSWEQDEEIVNKLKSWTDSLMLRRFK